MFTGIGLVAFCCIFGASVAGLFLGRLLPRDHHERPTQKTVQAVMSIVGLLAALVLGLMVASAKSNLDTAAREVEQFSSGLILLDREAAHFGAETAPIRDLLRLFTEEKIAQTWGTSANTIADHLRTVAMLDDIQERLRAFSVQSDADKLARKAALRLVADLKLNSRLLAVQQDNRTPRAFWFVIVFWLSALFLSFALFAPSNATVVVALVVASFSVSAALNLIVDMDHPFAGYIHVSKAPMEQALSQMKP
ncbi:MAG: DUF4239 domain-containing protein [Bradyrhizobiaceae bacterium]|nr:MAG: DUF4239 domain-containing protein [Bradyrhizobiaceae bacterium]